MENYPAPAPVSETPKAGAADLEFPIVPDFMSYPPQLDPQLMLRRIEEAMAWKSTRPGEEQRRLVTKVPVEFVL